MESLKESSLIKSTADADFCLIDQEIPDTELVELEQIFHGCEFNLYTNHDPF